MIQQSMLPDTETLLKRKRRHEEVTMAEFLDACKAAGEMSIPADDPAYRYAERAGIPDDFLELAWLEFRERHLDNPAKKYRDWRAAFRNCVRDNWFRLWRYADGQCVLTVTGEQAARVHGKAPSQSSRLRYDDARFENAPKAPSKPLRSRWNNFDQIDYREGVNEDGSF
ncbi:hypothetical protein [Burkholderia sp. Ac-20353]|uniref:hypothetical protein n=1 Tax=Burkholderia sp. Ac-20353 TaxID=2703894 RepID=UPI00197C081F|nr:hypothetical protein [Burkholderia sp. Ac-20353]MBN3788299.1 hypothetical protein [Burkholderia sp. Ac-20353]